MDHPKVTREFITPQLAEVYLSRNNHNRNMRPRAAEAYAADMIAGDWQENGETIKFDIEENVLDGQHRLRAIMIAGVGIWALVVRDLPKQTQETIDTGMNRKFADMLKLRGEPNYTTLAATVRGVTAWERGERRLGKGNAAFTNTQLSATLEKYPWLREGLHTVNSTTVRAGLPATVGGPLWWVFTNINAEDADVFFQKLISGAELAETDPIYVLRRQLRISKENTRGSRNVTYLAAITVKAWNKYRNGEQCSQLKWTPGGAQPQKFPEPV